MLFVFADADFNSLEGSRSTQAMVAVIGTARTRGNFVEGKGCILRSNACEIARVSRSPLACEAAAVSNAVDMTGRYQLYLLELVSGLFFRDVLSAEDHLPLLNPFLLGREETNLSKPGSPQEPTKAA